MHVRTHSFPIRRSSVLIEADHGKLKILIKPVRGFKSIPTAYATIKGFEVMRALRTGQARPWCLQPGIRGEVRLVARAFGLGPSALTKAMGMLNHHFAAAARSGQSGSRSAARRVQKACDSTSRTRG